MKNSALEWKRLTNLRQIDYNNFVSKFANTTDSYFLEKIDGVLAAFTYFNDFGSFMTINDVKIAGLPVIDEYINILRRGNFRHVVVIGELVAVKNNSILPFGDLLSVIKMSRLESNKPLIYHYVYDIFSIDGKKATSYKESMNFILQNFQGAKRTRIPKYVYGNIEDFSKLYSKSILKTGIEGIVARLNDGRRNYKIKATTSWDVVVLGMGSKSMKAWKKDQAPYLITAFLGPDGTFRRSSDVGTGFTFKDREDFFKYIMKNKVQEIGDEVFVKPAKIIEIRAFRWRQRPSQAYLWTGKEYRMVGNKDSVILDMPSFLRVREDKSVNDYDIRLSQAEVL